MTTELTTTDAGDISRTFTPLGSSDPVTMTIAKVRELWATPTKSGKLPSDKQLINFIELCAARGLDPRVQDAYLIGYDSSGGPTFSLITAHQALLKRCEASPRFRGRTSGVVVVKKAADADPIEREGTIVFPGETLLGGWARIKLDGVEDSYHSVGLAAYNQGFGRWKIDPAGMITKCAEGGAIRKALPTQLAGCYMEEEMRTIDVSHSPSRPDHATAASALAALPAPVKQPEQTTGSEATKPPEQEPDRTDPEPPPGPSVMALAIVDKLKQCESTADINSLSATLKPTEQSQADNDYLREQFSGYRDLMSEAEAAGIAMDSYR